MGLLSGILGAMAAGETVRIRAPQPDAWPPGLARGTQRAAAEAAVPFRYWVCSDPDAMGPVALFLLPESPYPPRCGNALRDVQQVHLMRRMGLQPVLALIQKRFDLSVAEERAALGNVPAHYAPFAGSRPKSMWALLWRKGSYAVAARRHPWAWWAEPAKPAEFLRHAVALTRPTVVFVRSIFLHLLPQLRSEFKGTVIVDCHDADVHLAEEMVGTVAGFRKLGPWANLRAVRRVVRRFLPLADEVWAVSREDAARIGRDAPGARVIVVPSGVPDVPDPTVRPGEGTVALLVANYGYGPNANGAAWLLKDVWPAVLHRIPGATLHLVGGRMPSWLSVLASGVPGVRVHGLVPDLEPFYQAASLVVVPVLEGGGTRLKILDAWRHGKAVLTTAKGLEGIGAPPEAALVANGPRCFAAGMVALLENPDARVRLAEAGLDYLRASVTYTPIESLIRTHSLLSRLGTDCRLSCIPNLLLTGESAPGHPESYCGRALARSGRVHRLFEKSSPRSGGRSCPIRGDRLPACPTYCLRPHRRTS